MTYQVVKGEVAELCGLNAEIFECLGRLVNLLVNELPLHLIGGDGMPPEELVQVVSHRLQDSLGNVDVAAALDNFTVNQFRNLRSRVVLRSIELESLAGSGVVVEHCLEGGTNVNGLYNMISVTLRIISLVELT
jgi:hypothetical protein